MTYPAKQSILEADKFVQRLSDLQQYLKENLSWAQAKQKEYTDKKRLPAPDIRKGDMVWLDCRNLHSERPSKGLDYKNRGPFKVEKIHNNSAYELKLPSEMGKIHPVFHPWLLHIDDNNPLPGQDQHEPPPTKVYEDEYGEQTADFETAAILDSKIDKALDNEDPFPTTQKPCSKGLLMYKVLWEGYPNEPTWEPYVNLVGSEELLGRFHDKYKRKAGPHPRWMEIPEAKPIPRTTGGGQGGKAR